MSSLPNLNASEKAIMTEMAAREIARRRLIPFILRIKPDYLPGWFHYDLAARIERFVRKVEKGESPRLLLSVPPGHGKTEVVSRALPAWALGHHPDWHFLAASHTGDLANDVSLDVINYITSPEYQTVFPNTQQRRDKKGVSGWRTTADGRYTPLGVGAGISGRRAHVLIIDDPHKDQEAYSKTIRDNVDKWYRSSASTRLFPGGGICIIATRWAMDDLIGRRIAEDGVFPDGPWELVEYPCEATDDEYRLPSGLIIRGNPPENIPATEITRLRRKGDLLHPERWPEELLAPHRKNIHIWQALFQQQPTAEGAGFINVDQFIKNTRKDLPAKEDLSFIAAGDLAMTAKDRADYSVLTTGAIDRDGDLWIVSMLRGQYETAELVSRILDQYELYRHDLVGLEKTQHVIGLEPFMDQKIEERGLLQFPLELLSHGNKDKQLRAQPFRGMVEDGRVHVLTDMPGYDDLIEECAQFPGGAHDDIVDTLAYLGQMVNDVAPAPRKKTTKSIEDAWHLPTKESRLAQLMAGQGAVKDWRAA